MDIQLLGKLISQTAALTEQSQTNVNQSLVLLHKANVQTTFQSISERAHLNFPLPDQNPQHVSLPSDVHKAISRNFPVPKKITCKEDLNDISYDQAPAFPPQYSQHLTSEILKASSQPVSSVSVFLDFICQNSLSFLKEIKNEQLAILRRGQTFGLINGIEIGYVELSRHKNWHLELLTRVLSLCQHASINLPEKTLAEFFDITSISVESINLMNINEVNKFENKISNTLFENNLYVQQVLQSSDHFLSIDDVQRIFKSLKSKQYFSEVISIGYDHLNFMYRDTIVQNVFKICMEQQTQQAFYLYNPIDIIDIISQISDINTKFEDEKLTENQLQLTQICQTGSMLDQLVRELLESIKHQNLYGSDINFEKYASDILQQAILLNQNMHSTIPSFASIGYTNSSVQSTNEIAVVNMHQPPLYISTSITGIYPQKMNLNDPKEYNPKVTKQSSFTQNINQAQNLKINQQDLTQLGSFTPQFNPPSTFAWKVSAKQQTEYSLNFIFGLLTGANPQNRQEAAKQFIENETYKNIIFVKQMGYESAGYEQLVKSLHLIRFVRVSEIYAELIQQQSIISLIVQKFDVKKANQDNIKIDSLVSEQIQQQYNQVDLSTIFQSSVEFREFINFEQKYNQIKQNKDAKQNFYFEGDYCYNNLDQKIVFQQAIEDIHVLLLQDQVAIQNYNQRLLELGRRKYLEILMFNEDFCKIKYDNILNRQKYIFRQTEQQLYENLSAESREKYQQFDVENLVDLFQITFDILKQELQYIQEKVRIIKYLYEISLFVGVDQVKELQNLIKQISIQRPYNFEEYSKLKTVQEENDQSFIDLQDIHPKKFILDNLKFIEHPVTQIQQVTESLSNIADILDTMIQTEFDEAKLNKTNSTDIGALPKFYDIQTENFTINNRNYDVSQNYSQFKFIPEIIIKFFQHCTEIHGIFSSEAFPKVYQGVKELENQQQKWFQYEIYTTKQVQAVQLAVSTASLHFFITQYKRFKETNHHCFPLPSNISHLTNLGLLTNPTLLFEAVKKSIAIIKSQQTSNPETVFCSILGLLLPPGGAVTTNNKSQQTDAFSRIMCLRDLFQKADKSSKTQLSQLIKDCNFEIFEGFPAILPLPFAIYAKLINFQYSFQQNCKALIHAHFLRLSEIKCVQIVSEAKIDMKTISCFCRVKLGEKKYPYREILGYDSITNNLPFLSTVDSYLYQFLMNDYDSNKIEFFEELFTSKDFSFDKEFDEDNSQQQNIYDVMLSANLESMAEFPLFSTLLNGNCGIFCRSVYCEIVCNYYKIANLRNNQLLTDYVLINELIASGFSQQFYIFDDQIFEKSKYYDNLDFFKRADAIKEEENTFTQILSSLYYNVSEDVLANIAIQLNNEYLFRLKTYHPEEINSAILCTHRNQIIYNLGNLVITETKKVASQAQIRGLLNILRTLLYQINQDESIFLLDSSPIYRGRKQTKNLLQQNFIFNEDGCLNSIYILPHPVTLSLNNTSSIVLDSILLVLQTFESVVRHSITRNIINGYTIYDCGKMITANLEFLSDIQDIELDYDQTIDMDIIPEFLEGRDTSSIMKYNVKFKNVGYLSENEIQQIRLNVKKVQENISYQKKQNVETANELHEVTSALEYSKTLLALNKCIELRDKNELLLISSLTQSLNACIRKGLFNHAVYLSNLLSNLSAKYNFEILNFGSNITLDSLELYQQTQKLTFIRCFQQQVQSLPTDTPITLKLDNKNMKQVNPFEEERGQPIQQSPFCQLFVDNNRENEQFQPIQEEEFIYASAYSSYQPCTLNTVQYISIDPSTNHIIGQLVSLNDVQNLLTRLQVGCNQKGLEKRSRNKTHFQYKQYDQSHNYNVQPYTLSSSKSFTSQSFINVYQSHHSSNLDSYITSGFGLDGVVSPFNIFGISGEYLKFQQKSSLQPFFFEFTKTFEASLCSTLTQIELQSILASKGKSQWEPIKISTQLSVNHIIYDSLERIILDLHGQNYTCKDSVLLSSASLLGPNVVQVFLRGFKDKLETIQDDKNQSLSVFVQSKTPSLRLLKGKEQNTFLLSSLFIFLEEKQLDSIFVSESAVSILQQTEFLRSVYIESMYHQLRISTYQSLSSYINNYSQLLYSTPDQLEKTVYETFSSSDLSSNFIKFMMTDNQRITDLLFLTCRERNQQPQIRELVSQLAAMIGLSSEPIIELENLLSANYSIQKQEKESQFKQQVQYHNFTPADLIYIFLGTLHASFVPYCVHFIYSKFVRELLGFLKAPENQIHDIKYQQLQEQSIQFRSSDKGEFFKLKIYPVHFDKLIDVMGKFDLEGPLIQVSTYKTFQNLKINKQCSETQELTLNLTSTSKIVIQQVDKEVLNKSQALLNPLSVNQMNQLSQLEQQLFTQFEEYIQNEIKYRQEIHDDYIQKLQSYFQTLIETEFTLLKLQYMSEPMLEEALEERNISNKQLSSKIFEIAGIQVDQEQINQQKTIDLVEFTPNDDHQRIVENYQKSIRLTSNTLNELKIQTILYRNLSQYRLQILQQKVEEKLQSSGTNITTSLKFLYEHLNNSLLIDNELITELARITTLMSDKKAEIERIKREIQIQNPVKKRPGTAQKAKPQQQIQQIIQQTMQQQLAQKTLPILKQTAISKSLKICSEGEQMLMNLKQKSDEKAQLEQNFNQMQDALRVVKERAAVDSHSANQAMKKEQNLVLKAELRCSDLQKEIDQLKALSGEVLRREQERQRSHGDSLIVKLKSEISSVSSERKQWKTKREKLRSDYAELFRMLE
ncbi:hypothetical protein SS50377_21050 [Spironucleus salmonicida]|uniref:Uncharacterized protein n=1 Tax=Spironucleus salmonicida TaxID=348837 RepID=V6LHE5_9EUKA|nr:hypothetical protein SS50377_21050 [Spironucleus salmonicida]|eukprot:EST43708.1 hypothetical protein SS50377_16761 [Spironucleus salmonicida]